MNSNYNKSSSGSLNNFNFDLGIGSTRSTTSLNGQKTNTPSSYSNPATQTRPSWQPNKPSWTHQPAPTQSNRTGLDGPTSMVGDIFGKSWGSTGSGSGIGIVNNKNPNLFGDLVNSAMGGQVNKGNSNVPLKNAAPSSNKSPYSMGNLGDSFPKTSSSSGSGGYSSGISGNFNSKVNNNNNIAGPNLGGPSLKSMSGGGGGGGGIGVGMSGNKDPFGSLVDFGSKEKSGSLNSANKNSKNGVGNDAFGDFQNASKANATSSFPSAGFGASSNTGANVGANSSGDDFRMFEKATPAPNPPPSQPSVGDPLDMFFTPSSGGGATTAGGAGGQQSSKVDDWGFDSGFGGSGHDDGGATTELEGLPPPPAGVTASTAKDKGIDNQKQGQYADAIKWLSWAVVLLEKSGDAASMADVLSTRASCYKEVGEYKKAVADCTKVLEHDGENVSVLCQRALLYESMEKYRLGAEDLRTVLKIDPINRIARSTIHRLNKMAD